MEAILQRLVTSPTASWAFPSGAFLVALLATSVLIVAILHRQGITSWSVRAGDRRKEQGKTVPGASPRITTDLTSAYKPYEASPYGQLLSEFPPEFMKQLDNAKEAWLLGSILYGRYEHYYQHLVDKIERGYKLKLMLVHPSAAVLDPFVCFSGQGKSFDEMLKETRQLLRRLCQLQQEALDKFQVRTIHYPLAYSAHVFDPGETTGIIYIRLSQRSPSNTKPILMLQANDGLLYEQFLSDIRAVWEQGANWCSSSAHASASPA